MRYKLLSAFIIAIFVFTDGCSSQNTATDQKEESMISETAENKSEMAAESASEESEENQAYDTLFLENFSEALQARWEGDNNNETELSFEEALEDYKSLVDKELNIFVDCQDKKFEDPQLQEYAIAYMNGLHKQEELIADAMEGNIPEETFYEEWGTSFLKRAKQICAVYDNYDLKIDSKYMLQINSLHNVVYIDEYGADVFWDMLNNTSDENWEFITEDDGKELIKVHCVNQSKYEFKDLPIYCVVYDTKGTDDNSDDDEVETIEYVIGDWKPGEEVIMTFKRTTDTGENDVVALYN